jgi:hypothetical protein
MILREVFLGSGADERKALGETGETGDYTVIDVDAHVMVSRLFVAHHRSTPEVGFDVGAMRRDEADEPLVAPELPPGVTHAATPSDLPMMSSLALTPVYCALALRSPISEKVTSPHQSTALHRNLQSGLPAESVPTNSAIWRGFSPVSNRFGTLPP